MKVKFIGPADGQPLTIGNFYEVIKVGPCCEDSQCKAYTWVKTDTEEEFPLVKDEFETLYE